jgi:effector-binding domain-containing protein
VRGVVADYGAQESLWAELEPYLAQKRIRPTAPCFTVYHDPEYRDRDVDAEVCEPVEPSVRGGNERVKVYELPAVETMATIVHHGPFTALHEAYAALGQWLQQSGYRIVGPNREHYLRTTQPVRYDDPSYGTEIQVPEEKV